MEPTRRLIDTASHPSMEAYAGRLDGVVEKLEENIPGGQKTVDFLHGKQLGHPLHPVLTDLPIGAWSMAGLLDAVGLVDGKAGRGSTYLIGAGLMAAAPTAAAGALDWRHTSGATRRLGASHALLNTMAVGCYAASFACRLAGFGPSRLLSFGGLGLLSLSGYLGGHLLMTSRVGVRHADEAPAPRQLTAALDETELEEGKPKRVEIDGYGVTLVKHHGQYFALEDTCPHAGCSLADGSVRDGAIVCGCHGSTFALADGRVLEGPSAYDVATFETAARDGKILVGPPARMPSLPSGANDVAAADWKIDQALKETFPASDAPAWRGG